MRGCSDYTVGSAVSAGGGHSAGRAGRPRARRRREGRSGAARGSEMAAGEALFERVVQATGHLDLTGK